MQPGYMALKKPKVIVCMLAYNHGKFISQAIGSVFDQKSDFEYKLLICNDASTDNTKDIIEKYRKIYGDKIIAVHNNKNLGITNNAKQMYILAIESGAEYIATLEGDDYWIAGDKLQIQVDHMDKNQEIVMTCGNFAVLDDEKNEFLHSKIIGFNNRRWEDIDKMMIVTKWRTKYLTYVIRSKKLKETKFKLYNYLVDYHLVYELKKLGKIEFFCSILGVYRKHSGGNFGIVSSTTRYKRELKIYRSILKLNLHDEWLWNKYMKTARKLNLFYRLIYDFEKKSNYIITGI